MSNQGWPKGNHPVNHSEHGDYRLASQYARAFWPSQEPLTVAKGGMQSQHESSRDNLRVFFIALSVRAGPEVTLLPGLHQAFKVIRGPLPCTLAGPTAFYFQLPWSSEPVLVVLTYLVQQGT